jgi:hypothetical protein
LRFARFMLRVLCDERLGDYRGESFSGAPFVCLRPGIYVGCFVG